MNSSVSIGRTIAMRMSKSGIFGFGWYHWDPIFAAALYIRATQKILFSLQNKNDPGATEKFQNISEAYTYLMRRKNGCKNKFITFDH